MKFCLNADMLTLNKSKQIKNMFYVVKRNLRYLEIYKFYILVFWFYSIFNNKKTLHIENFFGQVVKLKYSGFCSSFYCVKFIGDILVFRKFSIYSPSQLITYTLDNIPSVAKKKKTLRPMIYKWFQNLSIWFEED